MSAETCTGFLGVVCPRCHARIGRPCPNERGYLRERVHPERAAAWRADLAGRDRPGVVLTKPVPPVRRGLPATDELVLF